MKKYFIIIMGLLLSPFLVQAINVEDFEVNNVPMDYFYPQEFDKLVLDVTIPGADSLLAITVENEGSTQNINDIEKVVLWADMGEKGFQGMGKDKKIGVFEYQGSGHYWFLSDLNLEIPEEGLRIFISIETSRNLITNRSVRFKISELNDVNSDGLFDIGDSGVFLVSKNNGPEDGTVINPVSQTTRNSSSSDNLDPVSVIDSMATITTNNYAITGQARDGGGSTPAWVKIGISDKWYSVEDTGANYSTWKYEWKDIKEGTYIIKTQSADWVGNVETEGDSITAVVDFPNDNPSDNQTGELEPEDEGGETPPLQPEPQDPMELLKQQISSIQEQIIDLLNQLIQLYLEELGSI